MDSQILNILLAVSPLVLAVVLVLSNRPRYQVEFAHERTILKERDEAIVALHYCRENTVRMEREIAGLRWLVKTYGISSATRPPVPVAEAEADNQMYDHIIAALGQEKNNLGFLKEQVAKYGDSDLVRHNQIEAIGKRIKELESMLDAYAVS